MVCVEAARNPANLEPRKFPNGLGPPLAVSPPEALDVNTKRLVACV